jgi:hypothetical protein
LDKDSDVIDAIGLPHHAQTRRQLAIAGLLGAIHSKDDDSETVGRAVDLLSDSGPSFTLCCAVARGMHGDSKLAVDLMAQHLESENGDDRAVVMLATALVFGGDPQWRPALERVLALSVDVPARSAALRLIDYLDNLKSRRQRGS